eukprot:JP442946.1.p1 GENE.JP442946.1~~JP442946.1.p1  ORF type:complete len:67 (-),score=9.71 JP442946.1:65-265(-)
MTTVEVTGEEASSGISKVVGTLDGRHVELQIPPGATTGDEFELDVDAFPKLNGSGSGQQIVVLSVV